MVEQENFKFLVEEVLADAPRKPYLQDYHIKRLHFLIQRSSMSQKRSVLMIVAKLKNQGKVSLKLSEIFEKYMKKSLGKDAPNELSLGNQVDSELLSRYKILNLLKFDQLPRKRLNFAFQKIKKFNSLHLFLMESRKIQYFCKILQVSIRACMKKSFKKLKVFQNKKKILIKKCVFKLIFYCRCHEIEISWLKLKIHAVLSKSLKKKTLKFQKKLKIASLRIMSVNYYDTLFWVRIKNSLNILFRLSIMRFYFIQKETINKWMIFVKFKRSLIKKSSFNERVPLVLQKESKNISKVTRILAFFLQLRLKKIFRVFYLNGLNEGQVNEIKLLKKVKTGRRLSYFLQREDSKYKNNQKIIFLEPFTEALKKLSIKSFYILKTFFKKFQIQIRKGYCLNFTKPFNESLKQKVNQQEKILASILKNSFYLSNLNIEKSLSILQIFKKESPDLKESLHKIVIHLQYLSLKKKQSPETLIKTWISSSNNHQVKNSIKLFSLFSMLIGRKMKFSFDSIKISIEKP